MITNVVTENYRVRLAISACMRQAYRKLIHPCTSVLVLIRPDRVGLLVDSRGPRPAVLLGAIALGAGYFPIHRGKKDHTSVINRS